MTNVWLITLLGMGTVFIALISLALVTAQFPRVFGRRVEKKRPGPAPLPQMQGPSQAASARMAASAAPSFAASAPAASSLAANGDGTALLAVIAAAIAASSGVRPDSFRIASLSLAQQDSGFNTPIWGRIERLIRS